MSGTTDVLDGSDSAVIDLGFVDGGVQVFGITATIFVELGYIDDDAAQVYGLEIVNLGSTSGIVNLGEIEDDADVFGFDFLIVPERNYRRIQLEGGGRQLFQAVIGDEAIERYFEFQKNGRRFPLNSVSNPVFTWRSPTGNVDSAVARIIDPYKGRVGVRLFEPTETGVWLLQVRWVDDVNYDAATQLPDYTPPYAPAPGAQEFWRQLPRALKVIVRDEGGW